MVDPTLVPLPPPSPHSSPGGTSRGLPGPVPATAGGGGLDVQSEEDEDDLKVISVSSDDQPATGSKSLTHLLSIGPPLSSPDLLQSLEQQQQQQQEQPVPDQDARSDNSGSSSSTEEGQESAAEATESHQQSQASSPPTKAGLAFSDTNL